ncbi:MAG: hypothetical protein WCS96_07985 [Victivallales bacterium]
MSITNVSRNRRALWEVHTELPPDKTGVYQLGFPFQISPTEIGVSLNIRWSGVKTIDLEIGNDLLILDHLGAIDPKRIQVLNHSEIKPHPHSGKPTLFAQYPLVGGFVPIGALRADGTPHPHAGTGFGVAQVIGFPGDQTVANECEYKDAEQYQYHGLEIQQYSYDGSDFNMLNSTFDDSHHLLHGCYLRHPGLSSAIPDGDDLLQPWCGSRNNKMGCGVLRWRYTDKKWHPVEFTPVTIHDDMPEGAEDPKWCYIAKEWRPVEFGSAPATLNAVSSEPVIENPQTGYVPSEAISPYTEPSLVRDLDGSLLFTARAQGTQPYAPGPLKAEKVCIWRSLDGGKSWCKILEAPHVRALTPMSLNRAADGTIYLAANPARTTNSLGQRLGSIVMRETLMIWPLSQNRRSLLEPIMIRDCTNEWGKPPHGSFWRIDHPNGLTVRLSDNKWHHVLSYRGLEHNECDSDAPTTPFTGTYIEEVFSSGEPVPVWLFQKQ